MIAALLLTGVCGILAVLTGSWNIVGRVMLSSFVAAIAAAMMIPIAGWVDDEDTRDAGLWGVALIALQFIFFLGAIWIDYSDVQWRLLATGFILFPVGWPAIAIIAFKRNKLFTPARITALLTFAVSAAAFLTGIWWPTITGHTYDVDWKLMATGAIIYFYGTIAAIALFHWTRPDPYPWRWLGFLAALVGAAIAIIGIWIEAKESNGALDIATGLALFCAHAIFVLNLNLGPSRQARYVVLGTNLISFITIALACGVSISLRGHWDNSDTPLVRLTGAGVIFTLCATFALIIAARLTRGVNLAPADALAMDSLIDLFCPRCKTRQNIPVGDSACKACHLRISIKIEEPRCTGCGYLLYKAPGNQCPDCGLPFTSPSSTPIQPI